MLIWKAFSEATKIYNLCEGYFFFVQIISNIVPIVSNNEKTCEISGKFIFLFTSKYYDYKYGNIQHGNRKFVKIDISPNLSTLSTLRPDKGIN